MRITNKMMTNNMLYNINRNKTNLNILEEQYSSGKKIQRPSDDPVIAVRSLKLRTNLAELNQYYKKNIPDAKSWMNVTEGALNTANQLLTSMHKYMVQGANDTLTKADRDSIVKNLKELSAQIYQEGNTDYAGRYVFGGYKTDTSLLFEKDRTDLSYTITESFKGNQIENITKVKDYGEFSNYDLSNLSPEDIENSPELIHGYRIQLSYMDLAKDIDGQGDIEIKVSPEGDLPEIITKSMNDPDAYEPADNEIHYIPDTGELILGKEAFNQLRKKEDISITYKKDTFKEGDLRPEHYFNCQKLDKNDPEGKAINYTLSNQKIQYEVSFNQKLTINTQARDAFSHDITRSIEDIIFAIEEVEKTESKMAEVEKYLKDPNVEDKEGLERLYKNLDAELSLKNKVLQEVFGDGMTAVSKQQDMVNVAVADLGSRYVRLELTESRLGVQQVDFEDLLSNNEDVDLVETIIKYNSAETIYNASLAAAAQIVRSSLLDFL